MRSVRQKMTLFIFLFVLCTFYVHVQPTCVSDPLDSCELPCECWELNPGLWKSSQLLSTAEPSLQPSVDALKTWSHLRKFPTPSSISCQVVYFCLESISCPPGCSAQLSDEPEFSFSHVTPFLLQDCLCRELFLQSDLVFPSRVSSALLGVCSHTAWVCVCA